MLKVSEWDVIKDEDETGEIRGKIMLVVDAHQKEGKYYRNIYVTA